MANLDSPVPTSEEASRAAPPTPATATEASKDERRPTIDLADQFSIVLRLLIKEVIRREISKLVPPQTNQALSSVDRPSLNQVPNAHHGPAVVGTDHDRGNRGTSVREEVPSIIRTVIQESGPLLSKEKTYCNLTQEEYESIKDNNSGNAFEIRKHVKLIPPPPVSSSSSSRGNPLFNGAIVDSVVYEKMIIRCPHLLKAIKETVYWPSSAFYGGRHYLEINTPYRSIGVHREAFRRLLETHQHQLEHLNQQESLDDSASQKKRELETTIRHLDLFLQQVDKVQAESIELEKTRYTRDAATFDMLWMILKPGTYVYVTINETVIAARVKILVWDHGALGGAEDPYMAVTVHVWYLDHNGKQVTSNSVRYILTCSLTKLIAGALINRKSHKVQIDRFEEEKSIRDLPVYPEEFALDRKKERADRVASGRRYLELVRNQFALCKYDGMFSTHDSNPFRTQDHRAVSIFCLTKGSFNRLLVPREGYH